MDKNCKNNELIVKKGDRVIFFNIKTKKPGEIIYSVNRVVGNSVEVTHPSIKGYFTFLKSAIVKVVK